MRKIRQLVFLMLTLNHFCSRFGSAVNSNETDAVKSSEDQKRKARAERFFPVHIFVLSIRVSKLYNLEFFADIIVFAIYKRFGISVETVSEEEVKKKARLAKFSTVSKVDNVEDDKRKARAMRYFQNADNS